MAVNLDMTVPIRQTAQRECVDMSRTEIGTLFITAEPEDQVSVGNTRELKAIQTVMDVGPLAFRKENVYHATRMGVMEGLDRHRPQLVHFHAHGTLEGVFLEGPDGTATRITAQWLVTAFATYPSTRLVVLNTCTSVALAKALVQSPDTGVLGAVAWQNRVMAQDACAFVAAFYKRLASLDSVEAAFKFACAAVEDHVAANAVLHLANADFSLIAGVESVTPISNPLPLVHTPSPVLSDSTLANPGFIPADVAILIALEEEWEVFWRIAGEPVGIKDDSGGYLYHFDVPCVTGRPYRCVALFMGAMGPGQATHATTRLLTARPRTLVNLGIAAAIHDDLKLCDVVVAEQVDDYLATVKAVAKGKNGWAFELRGSVYKTTHALVQDLINLKFSHPDAFTRWRSVCAPAKAERADQLGTALEAKHLREAPKITKVHLASGPVLAAAQAFSKWLGTRDGLLKALEMEAAGMMLAAHQQADPARTLVLRGISDFGDERKSQTDRESGGAFRHLAMFNATQLLWAMMYQGLLPRHAPTGEATTGSRSPPTTDTPGEPAPPIRSATPPPGVIPANDRASTLRTRKRVEMEGLIPPVTRKIVTQEPTVPREVDYSIGVARRTISGEAELLRGPNFLAAKLACWQSLRDETLRKTVRSPAYLRVKSPTHHTTDEFALRRLCLQLSERHPEDIIILNVSELLDGESERAQRARSILFEYLPCAKLGNLSQNLHLGALYDLAEATTRYGTQVRAAVEEALSHVLWSRP